VDLNRGIMGALRHDFYEVHPEAFPYSSIRAMLRAWDWPQDYMSLGTHPDDRALPWTNAFNGVSHDRDNWFITQADAKPWEPIDGVEIHPPGYTRCAVWKIPVERDLDDGLDEENLPAGVRKQRKPSGVGLADYDHFGGLDWYGDRLYIAVEAKDFQHVPKILALNAETLEPYSSADLVPQGNRHASWCAINPLNGLLYSSSALSADNGYLHVYSPEWVGDELTLCHLGLPQDSFELYDERGRRITIANVQCGTFSRDGQLYLLVDSKDENAGVYGFDMVSGRRTLFRHLHYKEDEELEAVTLWDLRPGVAPHISGQMHVAVRSNDALSDDDIFFRHFREIRGQSLSIGPPSIVCPKASTDQDLSDHYGLSVEIAFRYLGEPPGPGQPGEAEERRIRLFTYNIAQVPDFWYEGSRDRYENMEDIARHLNEAGYDIVCIQEAFHNGTRDRLIDSVDTVYRHHVLGPQGTPFEEDSGLLILSRFPIESHDRKFELGSGLQFFAAKGILHARIQLGSEAHQTIDIFTSHTQSGVDPEEKRTRGSQLVEVRKFIKEHGIQGCWILAGDLNVIGDRQRPNILDFQLDDYPDLDSEYDAMMSLLEPLRPLDLWTAFYQLDHDPGYTYDAETNSFPPKELGRERLDYILVPRNATLTNG
jgi:endonuclease/exonuclease/phosphatase family metal-dependent hydrolase